MKQPDLSSLLRELHRATGFRISIHDRDGKELASCPEEPLRFCRLLHASAEAEERCRMSDDAAFRAADRERGLVVYRCPFGLWEAVCPICRYDVPIGYLMMGQVLGETEAELHAALEAASVLLGQSDSSLSAAVGQIPRVGEPMLRTYANIMSVFAGYITLSNILRPKTRDLPETVLSYLSEHYRERITLERLCGEFLCSRTHLLSSFKKKYGCSVSDKLNELRLAEAEKLITGTNRPVKSIAFDCGFRDAGYFSKVYRKAFGLTPVEARAGKSSTGGGGETS